MLNFYDKITCYPPHKILSEFEEILLLTRNNFYDKIVIINENDKINDDWINNDIEVIISEEQNTLLLESAKLSGVKNLISVIQNANFNDKLSFDDISFYLEGNNFSINLNVSSTVDFQLNLLARFKPASTLFWYSGCKSLFTAFNVPCLS